MAVTADDVIAAIKLACHFSDTADTEQCAEADAHAATLIHAFDGDVNEHAFLRLSVRRTGRLPLPLTLHALHARGAVIGYEIYDSLVPVIREMLEIFSDTDVNKLCFHGWNALHYLLTMADGNLDDHISLYLDYGADTSLKTSSGLTVYECLDLNQHRTCRAAMREVLQKHDAFAAGLRRAWIVACVNIV